MTFRGNFNIMFGSEILAGIITYLATMYYGIWGIAIGFIPFMIGKILVLVKYELDEREMSLTYKVNSIDGIFIGILAGIIYLYLPHLDWFFVLVSGSYIISGIIGLIVFQIR
jgi:hypothetical protein